MSGSLNTPSNAADHPLILAVDSAFELCSVACLGSELSDVRISTHARKHADDILVLVQSLLETHQLALTDFDAIAMTSGPGSFTGLRIGTAVVQGLAFGSGRPVVCISSLAALIMSASSQQKFDYGVACLHAREDEFYFAIYRVTADSTLEAVVPDCIATSEEIQSLLDSKVCGQTDAWLAVGQGWQQPSLDQRAESFGLHLIQAQYDARTVATLARQEFLAGRSVAAALASPVYLKDELDYRTV